MTRVQGRDCASEMSLLERNLLGVPVERAPLLLPGILAAVLLGWASIWLTALIERGLPEHLQNPISPVMVALVLGLIAGNALPGASVLKPGLKFVVSKVLRLGIILLGIRLSMLDVVRLGALGVPIVILCIGSALLLTTWITRRLGLGRRLGTLVAVGTAICGVSAILATGPAIDADDEEIAYAVAVITVFGMLATFVYPYLAHTLFAGDPVKAGLFLGTAVHDTSQVTGAGMVYAQVYSDPQALDVAAITKMVRNAFMALVIPAVAVLYSRRSRTAADGGSTHRPSVLKLLPLFVLGFLALALVRTIGDAGINDGGAAFGVWNGAGWSAFYTAVKEWAANLLVVALAGVGLSTSVRAIRGLGLKPFLIGLGAALAVGVVSAVSIVVLGSLVTL